MQWIARFLAAGTAVTLSGLVASRVSAHVGGMILAFPFVIGTGLIFAMRAGDAQFSRVASGVLWGLVPLALFTVAVIGVVRVAPAPLALAVGAVVWVCTAGVLQWLR